MLPSDMEDNNKYVRIQEEVNEAIELANIDETELKKISQVILPATTDNKNSYRLIEIDANLCEAFKEGNCLSFRGKKNSSAVLCTKNLTYQIKEAETSNTLLLVPNLKLNNDIDGVCADPEDRIIEATNIVGQFNTYYELQECKPKLGDLIALLEPSSFKGLEYESKLDSGALFDWDRLQSHVQASEGELKEALAAHLIVKMNGYFRLVSFEFEARALTLMLDFLDENSWEMDEVDKDSTGESLRELVPNEIFDFIFDKYTRPSEKTKKDGSPLYEFLEEKTCKVLAQILMAASPVTDYRVFMEAWKVGGPDKLKPKEKYLSGIALIKWNSQKGRKEIVSYPESNLPENIVPRLNQLFKAKDNWTVDEIMPYISRCTTRTMDVNALLTKYARPTMVNGVKCYSSKHGK